MQNRIREREGKRVRRGEGGEGGARSLGNHEHAIMPATTTIKSTHALHVCTRTQLQARTHSLTHTHAYTHTHTCRRAYISYDLLLFRAVFRYYLNFK